MASWDDVRRIALALPEAAERVCRDGLSFWEVLGARVKHLGVKEALLESDPAVFLTTPHFDGYAAVLVRLGEVGLEELVEVVAEAWLARAPKRLSHDYLERVVLDAGGGMVARP